MTVDFPLFIHLRRTRVLWLLVALGMVCLGGAASRVWATQSVQLTWNDSDGDGAVSHNVYIGTQSGVYSLCINGANVSEANVAGLEVCNAVIPGLQDGTTYYFAVTSVDADGNESERSNEANYAVPASGLLALQVQATAAAFQAVQASWTPSTESSVYGYLVSYGTQSGVYTGSTEFDDANNGIITGLVGGATNYFILSPIDDYGVEAFASAEVSCVVPTNPPCVLSAEVSTNAPGVALSWNDLTSAGAVGYNIYYGTQSGNYSQSSSCGTVTNLIVTGLEGGQIYYFAIAAVDASGDQGPLSSEASAVAPLPAPMVLQMQTFTDDNGQPYGMQLNTYSVVAGAWEMDSSTNLQDWTYYTSGYGGGNGDGYDVYAWISIDPTVPQVFFRVVQATVTVTAPAPMPLQSAIITDGNGQPQQMEIFNPSAVSGAWTLEYSTDLKNWTPWPGGNGSGYGQGDGYDVDVSVPIDPTAPQMFFRVVQ